MGFFQILNLKQRQLPIFFMVIGGKKMGNWRCFKLKILKKAHLVWNGTIGQRQIAIYVFSVSQI